MNKKELELIIKTKEKELDFLIKKQIELFQFQNITKNFKENKEYIQLEKEYIQLEEEFKNE